MAIDGGLGQEIHRLGMGVQQPFHPDRRSAASAAAGPVQIIRPLRRRFLLERGEEDRFHPRRTAHGIAPIPKGPSSMRRIPSRPLTRVGEGPLAGWPGPAPARLPGEGRVI